MGDSRPHSPSELIGAFQSRETVYKGAHWRMTLCRFIGLICPILSAPPFCRIKARNFARV